MEDMQRKLSVKLTQRFYAVLAEIELRRDKRGDAEFWGLWNAVNGAASRLGLPCDDTPVTLSLPPASGNSGAAVPGIPIKNREVKPA